MFSNTRCHAGAKIYASTRTSARTPSLQCFSIMVFASTADGGSAVRPPLPSLCMIALESAPSRGCLWQVNVHA